MKTREEKIKLAIEDIYNDYVGGWINMTCDYEEDSEEYNHAIKALRNPASLIDTIVKEIMEGQGRIIWPEKGLPFNIDGSFRFYGKENTRRLVEQYIKEHTDEKGEMY